MITDFLSTKLSREELSVALKAIREFKGCESEEEFWQIPLAAWAKLEQVEEMLDYLVNGISLREDTIAYLVANGKPIPMTRRGGHG